jgi:hypothetical protein
MDAEFFRARLSELECQDKTRNDLVFELMSRSEVVPMALDEAVSFLVDRIEGPSWEAVTTPDKSAFIIDRRNGPNYVRWDFYRCGPNQYLRDVYYELA